VTRGALAAFSVDLAFDTPDDIEPVLGVLLVNFEVAFKRFDDFGFVVGATGFDFDRLLADCLPVVIVLIAHRLPSVSLNTS
jgi:hypothetical protein